MATGTQNKIYSNLNWRPLHVRDSFLFERGNVAPFSVIGGENGTASVIGPNSNPGASPDVPSVIGVYSALSEAAQPGNIRTIDAEVLLNYPGSTAIEVNPTGVDGQPTSANQNTSAASIAAIRGGITVGGTYTSPAVTSSFPSKTTATTITAGFLYGVQGKLTLGAGATLNNGSAFNCAVLAQFDTSAAGVVHTSGYFAPIIADFGASSSLATDTLANMLFLSNNTACVINAGIKMNLNATYVADLSDPQGNYHWLTAQTGVTSVSKALSVFVDGVHYFIPLCTSSS